MSDSVLHRIAARVAERLAERRRLRPETELRARASAARRPHDFLATLRRPGYNVIAEVKFASPSQGALTAGAADPVAVAGDYLANGAAALSVLTERDYFHGSHDYLAAIRARFPEARLLMKDFVVDEYQLLEARAIGADAALLIVALLGRAETARLLRACGELGLTALVEVHDEAELAIAQALGAPLIGVNNRDLKTLRISLDTSYRLIRGAGTGPCLISESGIENGAQMRELREAGFAGFLVGSSFMRGGDPGAALGRALREAEAGP